MELTPKSCLIARYVHANTMQIILYTGLQIHMTRFMLQVAASYRDIVSTFRQIKLVVYNHKRGERQQISRYTNLA